MTTYETKDTGEAIALALCGILDLANCERRVTRAEDEIGKLGVCFWECADTDQRRIVSDAYFAQVHRGTVSDLSPDLREMAQVVAEVLRHRKQIARDFPHVRGIIID